MDNEAESGGEKKLVKLPEGKACDGGNLVVYVDSSETLNTFLSRLGIQHNNVSRNDILKELVQGESSCCFCSFLMSDVLINLRHSQSILPNPPLLT